MKLAAAIGQRLLAFATASGRAILAFLPDQSVQDILKQGMPQYTRHTRSSPEAFFDGLRLVRERGFALDEQEFEEGIDAVAAPVFDQAGQPMASVSVAGPAIVCRLEKNNLWSVNTDGEYHEEIRADRKKKTEKIFEEDITRIFPRLDPVSFGFSIGMTGGILIFLATLILVLKNGVNTGPHLALLSNYLPGYTVSMLGAVVGLLYIFGAGFLLGSAFAYFRNLM